MIHSADYVPRAYARSRDYQSILALLDLPMASIKHDTDSLINLINPRLCPVNLLPLLASYVGYEYDNNESVAVNRTIIEYFPYLIRNKGSEIGISLAAALSVNAIGDPDALDTLTLFHIEYVESKDENGIPTGQLYLYIYYPNYLTKIRDMIEVVRPAGMPVILVPSIQIESIERIEIYDEWKSFGYEYVTGRLIRVDNHEIVMRDDKIINLARNIYRLTDDYAIDHFVTTGNVIIDKSNNYIGYYVYNDSSIVNMNQYTGYHVENGVIKSDNPGEKYDGYTISEDMRILDTNGTDTGYYIDEDQIYDKDKVYTGVSIDVSNRIIGVKVANLKRDLNNKNIIYNLDDNSSGYYIGDTNYITDTTSGEVTTTKYFVNEKGNVVDNSGTVALSWIDRYHIAESYLDENGRYVGTGTNRIGFSEIAGKQEGLYVDSYYFQVTERDEDGKITDGYIVSENNGVSIDKGIYHFRDNREINIIKPFHIVGQIIDRDTKQPISGKVNISGGLSGEYEVDSTGIFDITIDINGTIKVVVSSDGYNQEIYNNLSIIRGSVEYMYDLGVIQACKNEANVLINCASIMPKSYRNIRR